MTVRALLRNAWLVLLVGITAVLAAVGATSQAVPKYQAQGTYVIGPSAELTQPETIVRSFDSLQGQGIVPTLVELLSSETIAARVAEPLGVSRSELKAYEVRANVLSSSNTLQLTVVGPNPGATAQLAIGIGLEASAVFERLYSVYQIEPLDIPRTPEKPISPSLVRNCVLALILGLSAGGALAVLRTRYASSRHPGPGALAASDAPSEAMSPPASGVFPRPEGVAGPSVSAPPPFWGVQPGPAGPSKTVVSRNSGMSRRSVVSQGTSASPRASAAQSPDAGVGWPGPAEADVSREAAIATVPRVASGMDFPPGADVALGTEVPPEQHVVADAAPARAGGRNCTDGPPGSAEPPPVSAATAPGERARPDVMSEPDMNARRLQ